MMKKSVCFLVVAAFLGAVSPVHADNLERSGPTVENGNDAVQEEDLFSPEGLDELTRLMSSNAPCKELDQCYYECEIGRRSFNPRIKICKFWCDIGHFIPHLLCSVK